MAALAPFSLLPRPGMVTEERKFMGRQLRTACSICANPSKAFGQAVERAKTSHAG